MAIKSKHPVLTRIRIYVHTPGQFLTNSRHTYYDLPKIPENSYNEIELGYEAFEMLDSKKRKCFDYKNQSRDECILSHIEKVEPQIYSSFIKNRF